MKQPQSTRDRATSAFAVSMLWLFAGVASAQDAEAPRISGYYQFEAAYTTPSPAHWSKLRNRLELAATGAFSADVKWKLSGGVSYDPVFDVTSFYPAEVRKDRRFDAIARENYLDIGLGDFDLRLGRQHIVWGEVVSLFVADVVSAKDLREFVLPDFDLIRIPQWAARGEYTKGDFHAELVWIPVQTFDRIGKPGDDFYPYPPTVPAGYRPVIAGEEKPSHSVSNSAWGARVGYLKEGWDGSVFIYRSFDTSPSFRRGFLAEAVPSLLFTPIHSRIWQAGATLSKDFERVVLKAEAVYTHDRSYGVARFDQPDGLVRLSSVDYIIGLDYQLAGETRLNGQFFQRVFLDYDSDIGQRRVESAVSLLLSMKPRPDLEPQLLLISSLNRSDWMVRPKIVWSIARNWRLTAGADLLGGARTGFFGRFANSDRVYVEARYSF
jgi:hypothetical protein